MSQIIESPILTIEKALRDKQTIAALETPDGLVKIKPLGIFSRIWHWKDRNFHKHRLSKVSSIIAKVISQQPRLSIADAAEDQNLKTARKFLKEIRLQGFHSLSINELKKELTAAKLGIHSITFDTNPGLQKFVESHHLERYLLRYNAPIQIDPITKKASLQKEGVFQSWENLFPEINSWPKRTNSPQLPWVYGAKGIQNEDMYDWSELKPFMKGDPADWNNAYVFEFCVCQNPNSIKNGNHSWLRLKNPTGDIYSVGLYRPEKTDFLIDNLRAPFRIKPGHLMQPDVSEFWDFPISTIEVAINEASFQRIKETIEADKKNEDIVFQLFNNNCVLYCKKLGIIGGIDLPTIDSLFTLLGSPSLVGRVSQWMSRLPNFVQKICLTVAAVFLNISQVALGGCMIDKQLNKQQRIKGVPYFTSIKDIFDVNKIYLNHPNTLALKTRPEVLKWRQEQIAALSKNDLSKDAKKKTINLSLPPSYYLKPDLRH